MGRSIDTHGKFVIASVFPFKHRCFILALEAASTVQAILMFWFQKEEEK